METLKELIGYAENVRQVCHLHLLLLQPWKWPTRPWSRLHIDYAGPMYGNMCLIIVDAHSKWIKAAFVPSASSAATNELFTPQFICSLWTSIISGYQQCTLLCGWENRILFQTKWHPIPNFTALSSGVQRSCGTCGTDHKERSTEGDGGHSKYSTVQSAFHILDNS